MSEITWHDRLQAKGLDVTPEPCPTCGHVPTLARYRFTSTMALATITLYNRGARINVGGSWLPESQIHKRMKTGDSLKKLKLWGIVESRARAGEIEWALTEYGLLVALEEQAVRLYGVAAHGLVFWFEGDRIKVSDALDRRYSYIDLMKRAVPA